MKIAVLTSGGVDSSVALKLLANQGYDVTAFYLKIWLEDEIAHLGNCPWEEDISYIRQICSQAGIPLEVVSLQKAYWSKIVTYTINEVKAGRTPSPDLLCNKFIKFGAFFDHIGDNFQKIATGHYACIEEIEGKFFLKKACDKLKDQTYFLSRLSQQQISKIIFPLGHLLKSDVRELACRYNLPNKSRKDSQGICFLGKINFSDFIKHHVGTKRGNLVDIDTNKKVGEHDGFWFYTIGQRRGIGLSGGPWYVAKKDSTKNIVYISNKYNLAKKDRNKFIVSHFNWFNGAKKNMFSKNLGVKIRHGEQFYGCSLQFDQNKKRGFVELNGQDQGIASGQFAVFYDDSTCLGSGIID
jgi:tRNA (5-methylaminomethyl-2-thiouridylate)-methyltransferase